MEANSTDKKTFQLTDNGEQLGELSYENLFSLKAKIKLASKDIYDITPLGFFGTSISVTKNGTEIANLKTNWRGQIVLTFQDGHEFICKSSGPFLNRFITENKEGEIIMQLDPKFNWRKFNYNYGIVYDQQPKDILFILLGIYAANFFIASMSGAIAGIS